MVDSCSERGSYEGRMGIIKGWRKGEGWRGGLRKGEKAEERGRGRGKERRNRRERLAWP